ncbi:MAG: hypothetical protein SGBAC_005191 [Bacillariaceae sp.]
MSFLTGSIGVTKTNKNQSTNIILNTATTATTATTTATTATTIFPKVMAASAPTSVIRAREQAAAAGVTTTSTTPMQQSTSSTNNTKQPPLVECGVYMAPSTIGNYSNLGIYTGYALRAKAVIRFPEIAIPLLFRNFDQHPPNSLGDGTLWDRYIWGAHVADLDPIDDHDRTLERSVFVPGVGCTVNSMLDLQNIHATAGSVYDTAGVARDHPAAGSFSPYHSSQTIATREIPVGSELFANYGDGWIPNIPNVAVTLDKHLDQADNFVQHYEDWLTTTIIEKYGNTDQLSSEMLEKMWTMARKLHPSRDFSVLPPAMDWSRFLTSSTTTTTTAKATIDAPGGEEKRSPTREYWRSQSIRSIEWLQQHGKCQDHIQPGISTIPNAGRGAFASRNLPQGTIVGYAPLIHIGEAANDLLQFTYKDGYTKPELVLNYSFRHANSTLILTPYGAGVNYINHASGNRTPNVKVQWPKEESIAHKPEWLKESVRFLKDTTGKIGLSFDYVALRDITKGEELLMDYGMEWEVAWEQHVANYHPPNDASSYVHSSQYSSARIDYLKTPEERQKDPYPPNLHTLCRPSYTQRPDGTYVFARALRQDDKYVACDVLERRHLDDDSVAATYTVQLSLAENKVVVVQGVSRPEGIDLLDKVFSQDMHLPQAFRHPISIPDDIFPETWKNKL